MKCILRILSLFAALVFLSAGSCDKTNIRHQGTISAAGTALRIGQSHTLELHVPEHLEGTVHKASWAVKPPEAGTITYVENDSFGVSLSYTLDRTAELTPLRIGTLTVQVFMFHHPQTSPHLFAEQEFTVTE